MELRLPGISMALRCSTDPWICTFHSYSAGPPMLPPIHTSATRAFGARPHTVFTFRREDYWPLKLGDV